MSDRLSIALVNTRAQLLALRNEAGHWEGELSSSALSTATAIVALHGVDAIRHSGMIHAGVRWLVANQNVDGGWGDTTISKSNLSTTLLCWSALYLCGEGAEDVKSSRQRADSWILKQAGSLDPSLIAKAVTARYGKDKTFSVPILMLCTICGTMGEGAWRRVLPLPFELAAMPRSWFGAIGLPVVSYALPALIAIGYTRFVNAPPAWWNPMRWLRAALWWRISPMLKALQPSSGGYLEATPLTSFVTMALAAGGEKTHACVPLAVEFLQRSMRADGSWPIDTNLATWGTTLSVKALGVLEPVVKEWLLGQQYREVHPFTNAAPGGWAWTDLPGGVPDADDTSGALIALAKAEKAEDTETRRHGDAERKREEDTKTLKAVEAGITWLLDLQNRDGGMPTFCRGWGALPFDRSTPEITAHALLAWWLWEPEALDERIEEGTKAALGYLRRVQSQEGAWTPLWFGNEHAKEEENPVYGTAMVVGYLTGTPKLADQTQGLIQSGARYLMRMQKADGGFGGDANAPAIIEETAVAAYALLQAGGAEAKTAALRAVQWLLRETKDGTSFPSAPIGLYFARLWYHEKLYPVIWTMQALRAVSSGP
ncbi:prenyltransferase/squalene oxidase repeat-containing protein [Brevifollis gellanilyticus]|nr:prenyltransferase/squalene oxidase repeat-containing protein [Brevifollis gellanilyticus]